jgi:hypothetical protein
MTRRSSSFGDRPHRIVAAAVVLILLAGSAYALTTGELLNVVIFAPYALAGAFLAVRRPRLPIGWLLIGIGWAIVLAIPVIDDDPSGLVAGTAAMTERLVAWGVGSGWMGALVALLALTVLYPSGRLPKGTFERGLLAAGAGTLVLSLVRPTISIGTADGAIVVVPNPFAVVPDSAFWRVLTSDSRLFATAVALLAVGVGSMAWRAGRAVGVERQQYRWLVAALAAAAIGTAFGFVVSSAAGRVAGDPRAGPYLLLLAWMPSMAAFMAVPVAVVVAILRYRLYEIDRLISRTIGWALVTGVLVAVFAGTVVGLQAMLTRVIQGQTLAVAASTLIAFALFQPVRRRVQTIVDRRFDRARYDGDRTAAAFAERLREQVDLAGLEADIAGVVDDALRPTSVGVWIRRTGHRGAA